MSNIRFYFLVTCFTSFEKGGFNFQCRIYFLDIDLRNWLEVPNENSVIILLVLIYSYFGSDTIYLVRSMFYMYFYHLLYNFFWVCQMWTLPYLVCINVINVYSYLLYLNALWVKNLILRFKLILIHFFLNWHKVLDARFFVFNEVKLFS